MRKTIFNSICVCIISACASSGQSGNDQDPLESAGLSRPPDARPSVTTGIRSQLDVLASNEFLPVVIRLRQRADLRAAGLESGSKSGLRAAVAAHLEEFAVAAQQNVITALDVLDAQGLVRNVQPLWISNVICLEITRSASEYLSGFEEIDYIAPDTEAPVYFQDMAWGVEHINSPEVWQRAAGDFTGRNVIVAVLDSGVDLQHPDLVSRFWTNGPEDLDQDGRLTRSDVNGLDDDGNGYVDDIIGWDFEAGDNDPGPDLFQSGRARGHGTHVAGIIAGDGSAGVATGVAPGASLMVLKIGSQRSAWAAMQYAMTNGADIVNMSFGWPDSLSPDLATWRDAVDNLTDAGILVVAAAGSGGQAPLVHAPAPGDITTPGRVPRALTVAAVALPSAQPWLDPVARFSSSGPVSWQSVDGFNDYPYPPGLIKPDLSAPGVNIRSTMIGGSYEVRSGSSMAVAHVSGVAALLLEQNPEWLPHELIARLRESAWRFTDPNVVRGWGRVDALNAVDIRTGSSDFDLEIAAGGQPWVSDHLWVDNDGDGQRDLLMAGKTNRIFASVRNLGGGSVGNAEIRFYIAEAGTLGNQPINRIPPAAGAQSPFSYIGSYFAPVMGPAGSTQDTVTGVVDWTSPRYDSGTGQWTIGVEVLAPAPPNNPEANQLNNTAIFNRFAVPITPGKISSFRFLIYPDPDHPLDPFRLELLRSDLPPDFEVELSLEDQSVADWRGTIRGLAPVQPLDLAEFPAEIAYGENRTMRLLGDRGQLDGIVLRQGQPVPARLVIRAPEADNDVYHANPQRAKSLSITTANDFGRFGGLLLDFIIDVDAARIDNVIYTQE